MQNNLIYVHRRTVFAFNLQNPLQPVFFDLKAFADTVKAIAFSPQHNALLIADTNKVHITQLNSDNKLVELATANMNSVIAGFNISGNNVIADSDIYGLQIFNWNSNNLPSFTMSKQFSDSVFGAGGARRIVSEGNFLFLAARQVGFIIIDVSIPGMPRIKGRWQPETGLIDDIIVKGNFAYLYASDTKKLLTLDIEDKTSPRLLSTLANFESNSPMKISNNRLIYSSLAYSDPNHIAGTAQNLLKSLSLATPANPAFGGTNMVVNTFQISTQQSPRVIFSTGSNGKILVGKSDSKILNLLELSESGVFTSLSLITVPESIANTNMTNRFPIYLSMKQNKLLILLWMSPSQGYSGVYQVGVDMTHLTSPVFTVQNETNVTSSAPPALSTLNGESSFYTFDKSYLFSPVDYFSVEFIANYAYCSRGSAGLGAWPIQ
jgi:hypothetical protein